MNEAANIRIELRKALALHQAGHLAEAGELYQGILGRDPENVDALYLLGVVVQAAGNTDLALSLIGRAVELAPDYPAPLVNLGNVLKQAGRLDEAAEAFAGALSLAPDQIEARNNLAHTLLLLGHPERALSNAETALQQAPHLAAVHNTMGNVLAALERLAEAADSFRQAIALTPGDSDALANLADVLQRLGQREEALDACRRSVALDPASADKRNKLACLATELFRFPEALEHFDRALELRPGDPDLISNRGALLQKMGRPQEAVACLEQALQQQPERPDLHWNIALALLQSGDYARGWQEYEWRWRAEQFEDKRTFPMPEWQGEELAGKSILVATEQGFGDVIQFCRFVPLLADRGARVVLECKPPLAPLFQTLRGVDAVVTPDDPMPETDLVVQVMSLPLRLGVTLDNLLAETPYLSAPAAVPVDPRLSDAAGLKVGIVWAGGVARSDNFKRSCPVDRFLALAEQPGVTLFSLQVGPFQRDLGEDMPIIDLADGLVDFAHTAAAVEALDLVISVDTGVLHLAGALGRPAWGLMSEPTGFFWMTERTDSPWYPSIRLYRQPEMDDWESVFRAVARDLRAL